LFKSLALLRSPEGFNYSSGQYVRNLTAINSIFWLLVPAKVVNQPIIIAEKFGLTLPSASG
jgi:hypothetical protein